MINIYKTKAMKKHNTKPFYNPNFNNHYIDGRHMIVSGSTGRGKSSFAINLLMQMADTFTKVIVACKLTNEAIYACLKEQLKEACEIVSLKELPNLEELPDNGTQTLLIVDDFVAEKRQDKYENLALAGRKKGLMIVFLTQSYFKVSPVIRQNCGYIVLLASGNKRNLNDVINTIEIPVEPDTIKRVIKNATKFQFNVCIIDPTNYDINKQFRRNFTVFYTLVDEHENEVEPNMFHTTGVIN